MLTSYYIRQPKVKDEEFHRIRETDSGYFVTWCGEIGAFDDGGKVVASLKQLVADALLCRSCLREEASFAGEDLVRLRIGPEPMTVRLFKLMLADLNIKWG